ncbi:hypothetical protein GMRT_12046 [Giardia muris]|uniref:Myb-like domain-containing protein n=1 Tax=Giardia muris TaxID=5742 RepID=A0A4Z1SPG5_GIAMU|nr:hypothetical protein GMRT_12046 [Giardia muris]|eukprot:TNJ27712.1 hypothetical protein GMRT_12046 [Giardia muris]
MPRPQRVYCCVASRKPLVTCGLPLHDVLRLLGALNTALLDGRDLDWGRVGLEAGLPPGVCKTVWGRLCVSHARQRSVFEPVSDEGERGGNEEGGGDAAEGPHSSHRACSAAQTAAIETRLLQSSVGRLKERGCLDVAPPAEPAEISAPPVDGQAKRRFTAEEDRLLLKALYLHQGSFEAVQSRYFPTQPLTYVKSRYTATLKKHAMAHYGLKNAAELRAATSKMPQPRPVAELLLLYPWLGSEQFTEADLAAEAARLVEALR